MNDRSRVRVALVQGTQGTSSHAGKSLLTSALCRIVGQDGFRTAPFKAQHLPLNACPAPDGFKIGGLQATQAAAAGVPAQMDK